MNLGDREAAAEFLDRYGAQLRRRVHGKIGHSLRRVFDSQDILSTIGRRLDLLVLSGRVHVEGEGQLWSLLFAMAEHAIVDKARVRQRLRKLEGLQSDYARQLRSRAMSASEERTSDGDCDVNALIRSLTNPQDQQILSMWLANEPLERMAAKTATTAAWVRKRLTAIKRKLRHTLDDRRSHEEPKSERSHRR